MKGYLLEDRHLHDTLVAVLNAMASDWKATKTCVSNFTHFDNYASRLNYHESTEHMEYGCDALWGNDNVRDIALAFFLAVAIKTKSVRTVF